MGNAEPNLLPPRFAEICPPHFLFKKCHGRTSLVVQWLRIYLPMQETQVQSLGWEDPLEKGWRRQWLGKVNSG